MITMIVGNATGPGDDNDDGDNDGRKCNRTR